MMRLLCTNRTADACPRICPAGAVELRNQLSERFAVDLPATFIFDHPSLAAIAAFLAARATQPSTSALGIDASAAGLSIWQPHASAGQPMASSLVGISSRYPQPQTGAHQPSRPAHSAAGFWAGMLLSADLQSVVPLSRWNMDACFSPDPAAAGLALYTRFGAFCHGVDAFDAAAFRLSAAEGQAIDPQIRYGLKDLDVRLPGTAGPVLW